MEPGICEGSGWLVEREEIVVEFGSKDKTKDAIIVEGSPVIEVVRGTLDGSVVVTEAIESAVKAEALSTTWAYDGLGRTMDRNSKGVEKSSVLLLH